MEIKTVISESRDVYLLTITSDTSLTQHDIQGILRGIADTFTIEVKSGESPKV